MTIISKPNLILMPGKNKNKHNYRNKKQNKAKNQERLFKIRDLIDDCDCTKKSKCGCRGNRQEMAVNKYQPNQVPNMITSSDKLQRHLVMKNTMPQIARLYQPTSLPNSEEERGLYPASYSGPPGPECNWRKCSNKGGCGSECLCHPAGQYGWRCIPKCCIGMDPRGTCKDIYQQIQCTLPCSTWPGLCQGNFWNPYTTYQGPSAYPTRPNLFPAY